jgi:hypothetical protein
MIYSRQQPPRDVAEQAQLALYNFFTAADKMSKDAGFGGLQRLDIQVVDGQFSFSWWHGSRRATTDRGSKIEDWSDLPFLPKDPNANSL